ncbi:MAG: adenosine deaminase family protein, partial [Myxococcota bacterium]
LAQQAVMARDRLGIPVVGLDLAGLESGYPAKHHQAAYVFARSAGLRATVHAGEAVGVASIEQAVYRLQSHRLGHATHLYAPELQPATSGLHHLLKRRQVPLEVCVSSNVQTLSWVRAVQDHPVQHMLRDGLAVTVCTDNRLISRTCVTNELFQICTAFRLTWKQLRNLILCGFYSSFFPGTCYQKRLYIQQVSSWYDRLSGE